MTLTANPPIEIPLEQLTTDQQWQVFDWLSEKLADAAEPPAWHEDILSKRVEKIESGKAVWHDFEETVTRLEAKYR